MAFFGVLNADPVAIVDPPKNEHQRCKQSNASDDHPISFKDCMSGAGTLWKEAS